MFDVFIRSRLEAFPVRISRWPSLLKLAHYCRPYFLGQVVVLRTGCEATLFTVDDQVVMPILPALVEPISIFGFAFGRLFASVYSPRRKEPESVTPGATKNPASSKNPAKTALCLPNPPVGPVPPGSYIRSPWAGAPDADLTACNKPARPALGLVDPRNHRHPTPNRKGRLPCPA